MTASAVRSAEITQLQSRARRSRAAVLAEYIRAAKEDIRALDVDWSLNLWPGVGRFGKQGTRASKHAVELGSDTLLDPAFIDFAKAYVRERHSQNPGESRAALARRLQALRLVEASLVELYASGDPLNIDRKVFDHAAGRALVHFSGATPYLVAVTIQALADCLATCGILPLELKGWVSPVPPNRNVGFAAGSDGDKARQARLPNQMAVEALAAIFNRNLDPMDEQVHRDIYTTSVTALLMCAPSRGQEVHNLPVNLTFKTTDRFNVEQMGLRLSASKGFGAYIKWVWADMAPVAEKALGWLKAITDEARALARHLENPATRELFYRHLGCPEVDEDEPLTTEQACAALGLSTIRPLNSVGLSSKQYAHTLRSLWREYVLPRHTKAHPHFPYVSKKDKVRGDRGGLKFSEALFCMRADQMRNGRTSPVLLWMPRLSSVYSRDIAPAKDFKNIFERYGYLDEDGEPFGLRSHQIRHLLNTEAQRSGLSDQQISHWSGRRNIKQNETYDHRAEQERVEETRTVVASIDARFGLQGKDQELSRQIGPWRIDLRPKPLSCSDIEDIQPKLASLRTLYGQCHHDWAMAPCEGFVACLNCSEHACIKGTDEDSRQKLQRIETLHRQVLAEVRKAQAAVTSEDWGAQEWLETQTRYATKLEQLMAILTSADVPENSVIRLAGAQPPDHLHRAMRRIAVQALEDSSAPETVMRRMIGAIDHFENGTQEIVLNLPKQLRGAERNSDSEGPPNGA